MLLIFVAIHLLRVLQLEDTQSNQPLLIQDTSITLIRCLSLHTINLTLVATLLDLFQPYTFPKDQTPQGVPLTK